MTTDLLLWVLLVLLALNLALCVWLAVRRAPVDAQELVHRERVLDQLQQQGQQTGQRLERVESELRREISEQSRGGRQEMQLTLATFQETLSRQEAEATRTQNAQLDAFAQQLVQLPEFLKGRTELLDGALGMAFRAERHEVIVSGQGSYYALDGTRLRTMGGVLGEWIYRIDGFRQWGSFLQVLEVRYPTQELRNVRRSVLGTSYSHLFRHGASVYAGVYGGREQPKASDADTLGHRLWGVRLGGQWPLAPQWTVFASADWEHRRYGGQDPFFAVTRTDRQAQVALGLNWTPAPGWRVTPQWQFTRNASTLPITDYERRVFSILLRREF